MALDYRYPSPLLEGTLLRRYKRFLADVHVPGISDAPFTVHCANPGSMLGCAEPGRPVRVRDSGDPKRKLRFSLEQVRPGRAWVCVNTNLPNRVVESALRRNAVEAIQGYTSVRREASPETGTRLDFLLDGPAGSCWIEVKSVTLCRGREARFPDAVTARGLKHLEVLTRQVERGDRAVMLYLVGRADVDRFRPAGSSDPADASGWADAADAGVEIVVVRARISRAGIRIGPALPYDLTHE